MKKYLWWYVELIVGPRRPIPLQCFQVVVCEVSSPGNEKMEVPTKKKQSASLINTYPYLISLSVMLTVGFYCASRPSFVGHGVEANGDPDG